MNLYLWHRMNAVESVFHHTLEIDMSNQSSLSLIVLGLLLSASTASAQTITFDDISLSTYTVLANPYQGLYWNNFYVLNTVAYTPAGIKNAAYANGVVSPNNVAFNVGGASATISSSSAFTLNDAYFTAAFNNGLQIQAVANILGGGTYTKTFTVNTSGPTDEIFNFSNVMSITFNSTGGTPAFETNLKTFVMDNLRINAPVPEPDTYGMFLAGLGLMGFIARRRTGKQI